MIELTAILPLLMVLVLGCIDFGRFAYTYIAVINAARAGAAYGIMNNYTTLTYNTWVADITQAARDEMTQQTGYVSSSLNVPAPTVVTDANGLKRVRVTAEYPFTTLVHWPGIPSSTTLRRQVEMRLIR